MKRIKLKDESGDRKYFTQIPNMIVNHSTAYEQSLYLIMKRFAGEYGTCYVSQNQLAKKMGVNRKSVKATIDKLLKRKWIVEIEPVIVKGGSVRQFRIADLWQLNMKEYEVRLKRTGSEVRLLYPEVRLKRTQGATKTDTKKSYKEDVLRRTDAVLKSTAWKESSDLINSFNWNPSYKQWYGTNKTQRDASLELLKLRSLAELVRFAKILPILNGKQFFPTTTTPDQLLKNWSKIEAYFKREKSKVEINQSKVAVII